jgi:hypothetical protein
VALKNLRGATFAQLSLRTPDKIGNGICRSFGYNKLGQPRKIPVNTAFDDKNRLNGQPGKFALMEFFCVKLIRLAQSAK